MNNYGRVYALIIILTLLLQACVSPPPGETTEQYIAARKNIAHQLQQRNQLAAALDQWRIVQTLAPHDREATRAVTALSSQIAQQSQRLYARRRSQFESGDLRSAELNLLKVLSLQPYHQDAFDDLQKIISAQMRAAQRNKTASEAKHYAPPIDVQAADQKLTLARAEQLLQAKKYRTLSTLVGPADINRIEQRIRPLVYEADINLAAQYSAAHNHASAAKHLERALQNTGAPQLDARLTSLKKKLANDNYLAAKGLLGKDIDRSVAALERALHFDPEHAQARILLAQASRMQANLKKIEQRESVQ